MSEVLAKFDDLEYMVIGGWCPVLRNTSGLDHPGTLDVDVLFKESHKEGNLRDISQKFIDTGFIPSAKHPFQLLLPLEINGSQFLYNIDLLHPNMLNNSDQIGLFVDHLDFDVPVNNREKKVKKLVSIVLPNSEVLFRENLYERYDNDGLSFNLVSFEGMFLTKIDSCQKQKRERDALDIYLAFASNGIDKGKIYSIAESDERIENSLSKFKEYLKKSPDEFNSNISIFNNKIPGSPAKRVLGCLGA